MTLPYAFAALRELLDRVRAEAAAPAQARPPSEHLLNPSSLIMTRGLPA